jgi:hypothetical protein
MDDHEPSREILQRTALITASILLATVLPLLTNCSSSIYGWQVRTTSTPLSTSFDPAVLEHESVAVLGALTQPGFRGGEVGLDYMLGQILNTVAPHIRVVSVQHTTSRINQHGLSAEYARMRTDAEQSNILDRDTLRRVGAAIGVRYVFQPRLAAFGQLMTERWKLPVVDVRVMQTRSSTMRLSLQLWDTETGELLWLSVAEETMQSETVAQDPVYLEDAARVAFGSIIADLINHKTASTYTPLNKILDQLIQIPLPEEKSDH